jgi:hypothetical protein
MLTKNQLELIIVLLLILMGASIAVVLDPNSEWLRGKIQEQEQQKLRRRL